MLECKLLNDCLAVGHCRLQGGKERFFLGAKMIRKVFREKIPQLPGAHPQSFSAHGLQLPERLFATAKRKRQTMMVIVREQNQAGMPHDVTLAQPK